MSLIKVGFWKSEPRPFNSEAPLWARVAMEVVRYLEDDLPVVQHCIDPQWDARERSLVLAYVSDRRFRSVGYLGDSQCRICGKSNGSFDCSDGVYLWPEGLGHYIRAHSVKPPGGFVSHVTRRAHSTVVR